MKFDREAPGRGVEAVYRLENGKAFLEWRFRFKEDKEVRKTEEKQDRLRQEIVQGMMRDAQDAAYGRQDDTVQDAKRCIGHEIPEGGAQKECASGGAEREPNCELRHKGCEPPVIHIYVVDKEENVVIECMQNVDEEEPLETILVQPRLWQGTEDPYRYAVEAVLDGKAGCMDRLYTRLCLRTVQAAGDKEILLNGQRTAVRAVEYSLPEAGSEAERQRLALSDFRLLLKLGANSICGEKEGFSEFLTELCDRFGFLMFEKRKTDGRVYLAYIRNDAIRLNWGSGDEKVPAYRKGEYAFFPHGRDYPSALYYKYKAKWSQEPFVYLMPESVKKLGSGNYTVTCYSNCNKVALYSDGELFEFQKGDVEFVFQEVPAATPCIMLSAEGEGCSGALSVHKSFVRQFR